jgi:membrane protein implicated in regulation of membrane protease activity
MEAGWWIGIVLAVLVVATILLGALFLERDRDKNGDNNRKE